MHLTDIRERVHRQTAWMPDAPTWEDIDAAISQVQDMYIQPVAKVRETADFTPTAREVLLSDIAPDIYRLDFVQDITTGEESVREIPILNDDDLHNYGIRVLGDASIVLQNVSLGRTLRFFYQKRLRELGTYSGMVVEPDIDPQWHDLYWMGAVAEFDHRRESRFRDRLRDFERDRNKRRRPAGWHVRMQRTWR